MTTLPQPSTRRRIHRPSGDRSPAPVPRDGARGADVSDRATGYTLSCAGPGEAGLVHEVIVASAAGMPDGRFVVNDEATIARQMPRGLTVIARQGSTPAGILHVYFPTEGESYAQKAGDPAPVESVAHMDIVAVAPAHRGHRLAQIMLGEAEAVLRRDHPARVYAYATVHPENVPSKRSFEARGYEVAGTMTIHRTLPRLLLRKALG